MLLHDSFFHTTNKRINGTQDQVITVAYSPLFHSTFTLLLSVFGLFFNLICCVKISMIIHQYQERKSNRRESSDLSKHILSHNKYRFLLILASNDVLLCLSSIISCLDEKYFFQSFLARHHLCAAQVLIWKFTLHFIPLLIISILCRYHYILKKNFQFKLSNLSTLTQLLCTDLSILIPFVLALAWSVDGLWLWGEANITDFVIRLPSALNEEKILLNETTMTMRIEEEDKREKSYLSEQEIICYFQTNHNLNFTARLVHLIQADFLLLFSLHLLSKIYPHANHLFFFIVIISSGLCLELILHIRVCCCVTIENLTTAFNQERQICIYILYTFMSITLTSLPFYFSRTIDILFDIQLTSINAQIFPQILLIGCCVKPLLFLLLFFPSSVLFKSKCYFKCYSPVNIEILDQDEERELNSNRRISTNKRHCYTFCMKSKYPRKSSRTQSTAMITTADRQHGSLSRSDHLGSWLHLTNAFVPENSKQMTDIELI